jgi:hypothetical protein
MIDTKKSSTEWLIGFASLSDQDAGNSYLDMEDI